MYRSTGRFQCYKCAEDRGFKGRAEYALKELTGRPVREFRTALYGLVTGPADPKFLEFDLNADPDESEAVRESEAFEFEEVLEPYHHYPLTHKHAEEGVAYLEGRGVPVDVAVRYQVRYSTVERAVVFPIFIGPKLVGWQYRTIDPLVVRVDDVKYNRLKVWSSKKVPRDRVVMFADRLVGDTAFLLEGPVDAIKGDLVGGNVASMGKAVSEKQLDFIRRYVADAADLCYSGVRKLYIGLDPDAVSEVEPLLWKLSEDVEVYRVLPPPGRKDHGECSFEEVLDCARSAPRIKRNSQLYFDLGI